MEQKKEKVVDILARLGIALPPPPVPKGAYLPVVVFNGYAWVSGMLPTSQGKLIHTGAVDAKVSIQDAKADARVAALNGLSALNERLGNLDKIYRVIRVGIFVASSASFAAQPEVANGASELLVEIFGEDGKHARAAVGVASLPLDAPVEVEMLVALR